MYAEFYQGTDYVNYALFAFILFFVFFLGVVAWVTVGGRGKARRQWDRAANLPLEGDEHPHLQPTVAGRKS
jgi:cbb3-type cytochrome oxidase subunit 3